MSENAISLVQLPIIREQLAPLSAEIDKEVAEALSLAVVPETLAQVKKVRAKIRKGFDELEQQRKQLKNAIMEPYDQFMEQVYTPMIAVKFEEGDEELKKKINAVEQQLKQEKIDDLKEFFRELADSEHLDWLDYERAGINVTMSKSRSHLHGAAESFIERVSGDVTAIHAMPDAEEILVEYKRTLRLGEAVETVGKRRRAIEQERREREHLAQLRKAEEETARRAREAAETMSAPPTLATDEEKPDSDPVRTLAFTVTAPVSKLKELKEFLTTGGYQIG